MATIKQIEGSAVHQIQSGQVIVDLCSVVKELVENSLDAGATTIDVRFKNQGLDVIEVQDNGDGISSNNYETIALKHYTSKLSKYSDLTTLQTFGFRGEALSSLCALSRFSIITCVAADAPKGTRLDFEVSGKLKGTGVVAAQKGTTVIVENLFNNLPVRRRELERNIKREWGKVVGVLGQYACIQTGIKFSVTQQAAKGKKTTLFSTKGNQTTRENIVNVFGAKTLTALVPLDLILELEATTAPSQKWTSQEAGADKRIHIVGHISRPASGEGRQTPDRQMFFVNARPCGLPQVAKAFNDVYKSYNGSQSPFIFANIELDTHLYDVNVSPDKRTILLHDQSSMLENLKVALIELFESQDYTVPISKLPTQKQTSYKQLTINRENTIPSKASQTLTDSTTGEDSEHDSMSPTEIDDGQSRTSRRVDGEDGRSSRREDSYGSPRSRERSQESPHTSQNSAKHRVVNRESMIRDHGAVSLISNWLGRKVESRTESNNQAPDKADNGVSKKLSEEKLALIEKLRREARPPAFTTSPNDPDSSVTHDHSIMAPRPSASRSPQTENVSMERILGHEELLTPIPVLLSPTKSSSAVLNTFSSPRLQRASPEVVTITIGDDHTVISPIGTPYLKKQRTENEVSSSRYKKGEFPNLPLSSFGNRLSQQFAAPGTQKSGVSGEQTEELEFRDDSDSIPHLNESFGADYGDNGSEEVPSTLLPMVEEEGVDFLTPGPDLGDNEDGEYIDEGLKKSREEAKVQQMIEAAEISAIQPSQENIIRAKALLKGGGRKKDSTCNLEQTLDVCSLQILHQLHTHDDALKAHIKSIATNPGEDAADVKSDEDKLSLTISKDDFARMKVIGQFNLGFILASREAEPDDDDEVATKGDELFIIDQHASDEKYNFERLQASTLVQSQRLVQFKTLDLTAIEEEIVMENLAAIEANGFVIKVDQSGDKPVGQRCQLVSLPVSREITFSITDLEELLELLVDNPTRSMPRPSKVRKMFAMRACRSSIMIGRTLTLKQMGKVVQHLGELDKPWNCPHGRPTMRHLCGLGVWDDVAWREGDTTNGERIPTNWAAYVQKNQAPHVADSDEGRDENEEPDEPEGNMTMEENDPETL